MVGKNLNYFLIDGTPNGRIKCTVSNWTGVAYKIPRIELKNCKDIDLLKQTGVYFLFGVSDDGQEIAYIVQAGVRKNKEGILNRLKEHHITPKEGTEGWYEAIAFTTFSNSFGPTEISWLENCFYALAAETKRYVVMNGNEPNIGNVTEEKESELEEFIEHAKIVMGVLGHKLFEPLAPKIMKIYNNEECDTSKSGIVFEIKQGTTSAKGQRTSDGFVLFKGSELKTTLTPSCRNKIKELREHHSEKINKECILQEDLLLRSPNEAASFVLGRPVNAQTAWKTADGKSLSDIEKIEATQLH